MKGYWKNLAKQQQEQNTIAATKPNNSSCNKATVKIQNDVPRCSVLKNPVLILENTVQSVSTISMHDLQHSQTLPCDPDNPGITGKLQKQSESSEINTANDVSFKVQKKM